MSNMEDMKKYERMSRQELLNEVVRLHRELAEERGRREALEASVTGPVGVIVGTDRAVTEKTATSSKNTVLERYPYRNGHLTQEYRRNKKTGRLTGPYWQYRGVEDGKQINLYLGKTDDPEARAEEKLASRRR